MWTRRLINDQIAAAGRSCPPPARGPPLEFSQGRGRTTIDPPSGNDAENDRKTFALWKLCCRRRTNHTFRSGFTQEFKVHVYQYKLCGISMSSVDHWKLFVNSARKFPHPKLRTVGHISTFSIFCSVHGFVSVNRDELSQPFSFFPSSVRYFESLIREE